MASTSNESKAATVRTHTCHSLTILNLLSFVFQLHC